MDNDIATDGKHSRRDRIMGKLFSGNKSGRERKLTHEESANEISSFLGGADRLTVTHPVPPPPPHTATSANPATLPTLALDTSRATRYPQALDVESRSQQSLAYRARSHSPPRHKKKKGLIVRFSDNYPEIIGEGGDECETAVAEIGRGKRSRSVPLSAPIPPTKQGYEYARQIGAAQEVIKSDDGFIPGPIRRTQTGLSSIADFRLEEPGPQKLPTPEPPLPRTIPAGETGKARFLDTNLNKDENRRSFIEIHQHEQRQAEAMAFAEARSASANSHHEWDDSSSPEPVRETPPRRRDPPQPPSAQDAGSPPPSRGYSLRQPPGPTLAPSPMRSQSSRSPLPPPPSSSDGLVPTPPPKSAARSPLQQQQFVQQQQFSQQPTLPSFDEPPRLPPLADQDELRINTNVDSSPSSLYSGSIYSTSDLSHKQTPITQNPAARLAAPMSPEQMRRKLSDAASVASDDALDLFNARTKHLYELFRLYAEQLRPLETCRPEDLCRAALWWFLNGRSALELAIRTRPANPDDTKNLMARYQAYTDLSKGYWLVEVALAEIADGKYNPAGGELGEVKATLTSNLKKLAVSMKRNGLLPPEEPFLPQTMNKSIWIEYPAVSQDIVALLNGITGSVLAVQQPSRSMDLLEALPLGDTSKFFNYGRVSADVYLMEMGMESKQMYFPCLVSILRPQTDQNIMFVIASQNGSVSLRISSDKNAGVTWQEVKWRSDVCSLEVKLPRGFMLAVQCTQQEYGMLWSIYDFASKVQGYLYPRKEETVAYSTVLRGFHYFDANPKSRTFPKEPVGQCELGVYERLLKEGSPHGPRTFHRGFRVAIVTGPRTRTLSGVTHFFPPQLPIQFTFLRGDQRAPLLQLEFDDGKDKGRMVMTFKDDGEREKMLKLLNGTFIHHDEDIVAEVPLEGMNMSESIEDIKGGGFPAVQRLPWQRARIINDRYAGENPSTVLAEKLRIEVESLDKGGTSVISTITDRVNVAPGEVRLRLGTKDILTLQVLRQPQQDMTISVSDTLAPRDTAREFAGLQNAVARRPTVRTYRFHSFKDLHAFQAGLTGYTVLFDGIASTLNISRRRMVVPIHKKWDAGTTRIQVVRRQDTQTIQLLAFFADWNHGQCMGFVLKGTDVFESFNRNGKAGLKLAEAKFPLPRVAAEGATSTDDMAFLCLDMPDYAGENDDISILFEDSAERDKLCSVMPAPVKGSRRSMINT